MLEKRRVHATRRSGLRGQEEFARRRLACETSGRVYHVAECREVIHDIPRPRRADERGSRVHGGADRDGPALAGIGAPDRVEQRASGTDGGGRVRGPADPGEERPMASSPTNLSTIPSFSRIALDESW